MHNWIRKIKNQTKGFETQFSDLHNRIQKLKNTNQILWSEPQNTPTKHHLLDFHASGYDQGEISILN